MSAAETHAGAASGSAPDWHSIDWDDVFRTVRRLQARIVKAIKLGRWGKVKALVYLLTHSFAGRAMAVLRVVSNSGAKTPGVDGALWDGPESKSNAFNSLRRRGYRPRPLRRVYIPKSNGKRRPLGIPTMTDRAMQALHLLGLDPIAESRADGHSYGFRPERCCADALSQAHIVLSNAHAPRWVLEGDIKACFDRISHGWLLANVPMDRELLRKWLKAGYLEKHALFATTEGTPQGGIISPVLANLALDGLQERLAERFSRAPRQRKENKVHLVRYADDFLITGTSRSLLQMEVRPLVEQFLSERGLALSREKTSITHIEDGFDFLGQTLRRCPGGKTLLKPSRRSVKTFLSRIQETLDNSDGRTAGEVIFRLNQQIKGWTMYHRFAASKRIFNGVGMHIVRKIWRWCRRRHRGKNASWIKEQYFRREGSKDWLFTGVLYDSKKKPYPIQLMEPAKVRIKRYSKILCEVNPYDPEWEGYLEERLGWKLRLTLGGASRIQALWEDQEGQCMACKQPLRRAEEPWHIHHRIWRSHGGKSTWDNLELLHAHCHRQFHAVNRPDGRGRVSQGASRKA